MTDTRKNDNIPHPDQKLRIAVVGIGGVGGYLAARLAKAYPHVTVVARGPRGDSIRKDGLRLCSDLAGDILSRPEKTVDSAADLAPQDLIFLCVKTYSLEEVCGQLEQGQGIGPDTVIVPVMNGMDTSDKARSYLHQGIVLDALIYIIAFAGPDYSITQQGPAASLRIGSKILEAASSVRLTSKILSGAGIDHKVSADIESDIWKKYILNCAYNIATAFYDSAIGPIRQDPKKAADFEQLVYEAYAVAQVKGIHVEKRDADAIIRRFYEELAEDATSSLQRDVQAKRPTELETFSGSLIREAGRLQVDVPVSIRMYEGLKEKIG